MCDYNSIKAQLNKNGFIIFTQKGLNDFVNSITVTKSINLDRGKGCISKRKNGTFMGRYYVDGKQHSVYAKTEIECYNKLYEAKKQCKKPINRNYGINLGTWLTKWYKAYKEPHLGTSSKKSYECCIRKYISQELKDISIKKITSIMIQNELNKISYPRQKEITYNIFNSLFQSALDNSIINSNPMSSVIKQKAKSKKGQAFTKSQQIDFINYIKNTPYENLFLLYLYSGMRRNELLSLKWEDINYKDKTIKVNGTKTDMSNRIIPLFESIKEVLKKIENNNKEFIFDFKPDTVDRQFKKIMNELNFDGFTLHSLRHTFTTRCYDSEIPTKQISEWLGHSNTTITNNIYTHIQKESTENNINKLDNFMKSVR